MSTNFEKQVLEKLNTLGSELGIVKRELGAMKEELGVVKEELSTVKGELIRINRRLDQIDTRLDIVDQRLDRMETESNRRHMERGKQLDALSVALERNAGIASKESLSMDERKVGIAQFQELQERVAQLEKNN